VRHSFVRSIGRTLLVTSGVIDLDQLDLEKMQNVRIKVAPPKSDWPHLSGNRSGWGAGSLVSMKLSRHYHLRGLLARRFLHRWQDGRHRHPIRNPVAV